MNKRIEFIDLAKGFCIFLVVAGHLMDNERTNAFLFMGSFRMPLYFVLSGLFFSFYGSFKEFAVRKTNKLIIPFVAFYLLSFLFRIFTNILKKEEIEWSLIYGSIFSEEIASNAPIWFLPCLFICGLVFYVVAKVSGLISGSQTFCISVISCIIGGGGFLLGQKGINLPLWIDSALTAVPFYAFGYILRKNTELLEKNYPQWALLLFSILLLLYTFFFRCFSALHCNNMSETDFYSYYSCGLAGSMGIILFSKAINKLPVISKFGRYSICILLTHYLLITIYTTLFRFAGIAITDNIRWIEFLLIMMSYLVIIPLMIRFTPHISAQKDVFEL